MIVDDNALVIYYARKTSLNGREKFKRLTKKELKLKITDALKDKECVAIQYYKNGKGVT